MGKLHNLKPRLQNTPDRLETMTAGIWRSEAKTSTQRGYGYKWQKARAAHLAIKPFCVYCLRQAGIDDSSDNVAIGLACAARGLALPLANVVDHIVPHRGDKWLFWARTNWQSLCKFHHSGDKQLEERLHY